MKRPTRFYFSFRSPYSWIGAILLERRFPAAYQEIEYIPQWEPDAITSNLLTSRGGEFLYTPMSRTKHLYILQDIKRITQKLGLPIAWPVDTNPWWELPHLGYLAARRLGKGHAFFWSLYQARFERGDDICSKDVISRIASELGIDANVLLEAPSDSEIRAEGVEALYRTYKDGIFGVPFYMHGRDKFWGIDRFEDFSAIYQAILSTKGNTVEVPDETPATDDLPKTAVQHVGMYDTDSAGGCG